MIMMLFATDYEEMEAVVPCDLLRRGGAEVTMVGITGKTVTGGHGITLTMDVTLDEVAEQTPELLILPGGLGNLEAFQQSKTVQNLIVRTLEAGGIVGAICASPVILAEMGLLEGKRATCYPSMEDSLTGAIYQKDAQVVTDGNIITSRGPGSTYEFGFELLARVKGEAVCREVEAHVGYQHKS